MRFDTVIIGGGLAGLACGIRLAQAGKRCGLVSAGQSALSFLSGSFDLLNQLPDGSRVEHPLTVLEELSKQAPMHPYAMMGSERVATLAQQAESLLRESQIEVTGSVERNHQRITPLGKIRSTWLSLPEIPTFEAQRGIPWQHIAIIGIDGFLDFQPELMASALSQQGVQVTTGYLRLPFLDRVRENSSEFRSVNIARVLDRKENLPQLIDELALLSPQADAIIFPACLAAEDSQLVNYLSQQLGKPIMLVPTLPPSLLGMRIQTFLNQRFQRLGGFVMPGDSVLRAEISGGRVNKVFTKNHGDIALQANQVVLASGSFFSNGLVAKFDQIYEPIFGLDVACTGQRAGWTQSDLFQPQPYMAFGVKTDQRFRALINGQPVENLYAIGAVLSGFDPLQQGCGAGVSLLSALDVAETILATGEKK